VTDQTPADLSGTRDRAAVEIGINPPRGGSVFRIVDFPPETEEMRKLDPKTMHASLGDGVPKRGLPPRHPAMHATRTVDYAIVMAGEIDMLLDDSEIHLKAGDVLVQQGTNHAWVNRGKEPCRIAFVLIDPRSREAPMDAKQGPAEKALAAEASCTSVRRTPPVVDAGRRDHWRRSERGDRRAAFTQIRDAWHEHLVILLRDQKLSEEDEVRFAEKFGPPAVIHTKQFVRNHPAVMLISNIREDGKPIGALPDGEMHFHTDQCHQERPAMASMLYAIEVPSVGGNTLFANGYRAYETLPADIKRRIDGRRALNAYDYDTASTKRGTRLAEGVPSYVHPVVRTHPATGRKALYVNRLMTVASRECRRGRVTSCLNFCSTTRSAASSSTSMSGVRAIS
jgi:mannose-6-phosphate isomerase-like protein (cupin superfamily)